MRNGNVDGGLRTWGLRVATEVCGSVLVVSMAGRLATVSSGTLIETVVEALRNGHRLILCDLGGVDYASSAGLLALDAVAGRVSIDAGSLVLCNVTEPVRLVLDLSGLLPHFAIAPSLEAGLARLAAEAGLQKSSAPPES